MSGAATAFVMLTGRIDPYPTSRRMPKAFRYRRDLDVVCRENLNAAVRIALAAFIAKISSCLDD